MRAFSEVPTRRTQELVADGATVVWILLWVFIGVQVYTGLAELAGVGTSIGDAGAGFDSAGNTLEGVLSQLPVVGQGVADLVGSAFDGVADPLVAAGADLEELLETVAAVLALLVVAVALIPWLNRYLPWRRQRWQRLNAGRRAIRDGASPSPDVERILATRAISRLDYAELLAHTPDPIADFLAGRYDRLARAELTSVGLLPQDGGPG
jgi:hypothetical protein